MIHVRLAGGLGNQLFQVCAALAVAAPGTPIQLHLDGLGRYRQARAPDILRLLDLNALGMAVAPARLWSGAVIERFRLGRFLPLVAIHDRNFIHRLRAGPTQTVGILDGYFQSQWSWDLMRSTVTRIRDGLQAPWQFASGIDFDRAIHVRGGDFLKSTVHQIITPEFYATGFARLQAQRTVERVIVVTDDRNHAKRMLTDVWRKHPSIHFEFSESGDPMDDFRTLLHVPDRLIGNSTFSWWAAALGRIDGTTVSPSLFAKGMARQPTLPNEIVLPVTIDSALPIGQLH